MTCHARSREDTTRIGTSTYRSRSTETVVLAVSRLTYTAKTVTFYNTLETFTLACADNVNERTFLKEVGYGQRLAKRKLSVKLKFCKMAHRLNASCLEMSGLSLVRVLLALGHEADLNCLIAVLLNSLQLRYNARTSFNYGARDVLAVGTKDGCHSDFFS